MNPEEARTEYLELFNKIQALAPGGWTKVTPDKAGSVCDRPLGTEGTQLSFDTSRSPLSREKMDDLHDKVKTLFEATGFNLKQEIDGGPNFVRHTDVFGSDKFVMGLTTGKYEINLGGNTRCFADPEGKFRKEKLSPNGPVFRGYCEIPSICRSNPGSSTGVARCNQSPSIPCIRWVCNIRQEYLLLTGVGRA